MINSDVIWLTTNKPVIREEIERKLTEKYGDIIRWAIVQVGIDNIKISVTYKKGT